eukprot:3756727-Prymnesium_polylepis.1
MRNDHSFIVLQSHQQRSTCVSSKWYCVKPTETKGATLYPAGVPWNLILSSSVPSAVSRAPACSKYLHPPAPSCTALRAGCVGGGEL